MLHFTMHDIRPFNSRFTISSVQWVICESRLIKTGSG